MENISDYIQRRLAKFNEQKKINVPQDGQSYIARVRQAIEKQNDLSSRVEFEGINNEAIRNEIKMPIPEAFGKPAPKTYQSLASDGTMLSLDVY